MVTLVRSDITRLLIMRFLQMSPCEQSVPLLVESSLQVPRGPEVVRRLPLDLLQRRRSTVQGRSASGQTRCQLDTVSLSVFRIVRSLARTIANVHLVDLRIVHNRQQQR